MDPAEQIAYPLSFWPVLGTEQQGRFKEYVTCVRTSVPPEEVMLIPGQAARGGNGARGHEPGGMMENAVRDARKTGPGRRGIILSIALTHWNNIIDYRQPCRTKTRNGRR